MHLRRFIAVACASLMFFEIEQTHGRDMCLQACPPAISALLWFPFLFCDQAGLVKVLQSRRYLAKSFEKTFYIAFADSLLAALLE